MTDETHDVATASAEDKPKKEKSPSPPPAGNAIYGLGVFGAAYFFWQRADTPAEKAVAVLKGLVWPAFMVHAGFTALERVR